MKHALALELYSVREDSRCVIIEGVGVDADEASAVDEDLWPCGALGDQLRPVLQQRVLLLQYLHTHTHTTI